MQFTIAPTLHEIDDPARVLHRGTCPYGPVIARRRGVEPESVKAMSVQQALAENDVIVLAPCVRPR